MKLAHIEKLENGKYRLTGEGDILIESGSKRACMIASGKNCILHQARIEWMDSCGKYETANTVCINCINYKSGFCTIQNDTVSPNEMCGYFNQIISDSLLNDKRR